MRALTSSLLGVAMALAVLGGAEAQVKIKYGYTAVGECLAGWVAIEKGFFKKRGIEAESVLLRNSAIAIPGLASNEIQFAINTLATTLQAVDGGLPIRVFASASTIDHDSRQMALVGRIGLDLKDPKDYVGKRIAVSGLTSSGYVVLRWYLRSIGVDPQTVKFVEVPMSQIADVIRSGSADAGVLYDPLIDVAINSEAAQLVQYMAKFVPNDFVISGYVVSKDWADKNPETLKAIREALVEATEWAEKNKEESIDITAKYLNVKREMIAGREAPHLTTALSDEQVQWWIDAMKQDGLLRSNLKPADVTMR